MFNIQHLAPLLARHVLALHLLLPLAPLRNQAVFALLDELVPPREALVHVSLPVLLPELAKLVPALLEPDGLVGVVFLALVSEHRLLHEEVATFKVGAPHRHLYHFSLQVPHQLNVAVQQLFRHKVPRVLDSLLKQLNSEHALVVLGHHAPNLVHFGQVPRRSHAKNVIAHEVLLELKAEGVFHSVVAAVDKDLVAELSLDGAARVLHPELRVKLDD